MANDDLEQLARRQLADYERGTPGTAFADGLSLTIEEAYRLQSLVTDLRIARGERMVGYKVGCTSPVIRKRLGAEHPVFGRLFDGERHASGSRLPASRFNNLAIEGELAVKLVRDVSGDADRTQIVESIGSVFAVIELHNLVFHSGQPSAEELIANNAIHAGFVRGDTDSDGLTVDSASLRIAVDNEEVAAVAGPKLVHTIVDSLSWLSGELVRRGLGLQAGQSILCGSVADLFPVDSGRVLVTTDGFGAVECTIGNDA